MLQLALYIFILLLIIHSDALSRTVCYSEALITSFAKPFECCSIRTYIAPNVASKYGFIFHP